MFISLFAFLLIAIANASQKTCFLSGYEVGKTFMYHYETSLSIQKSIVHANNQGEKTKQDHHISVEASIQCLGIDENNDYNFELRVHSASWRQVQNADYKTTLEQQKRIDAAFTDSLQRSFYYTQRCNMELVDVFHPQDESEVTLNVKRGLVLAFDNRLRSHNDDGGDDSQPSQYMVEHSDHLGVKPVEYTHSRDEESGELRIEAVHDGERQIPVESASDVHEQRQHVPLATRTAKTTTMRDGVVHRIEKRDASNFPAPSADQQAKAERTEHDAGTFHWSSNGHGVAILLQDERARSTIAKRHAPNPLPGHYTSFEAALNGRHRSAPLVKSSPLRALLKHEDTDGVGTLLFDTPRDARSLMLGDEPGAEPGTNYRTMIAWLRRQPLLAQARLQASLVELAAEPQFSAGELQSARTKFMRALQEADTSESQRELANIAAYTPEATPAEHEAMFDGDDYPRAVDWTVDDRNSAIILLSLMKKPTEHTLDTLQSLMQSSEKTLARQASMVYGIASAKHHKHGGEQRAKKARFHLLNSLMKTADEFKAGEESDMHTLKLSMDNALRGLDDDQLDRDGLGDELRKRASNGGNVITNFIRDAKCAPGACDAKSYDQQRPADPVKKAWNNTFGVNPFHAYLETILDYNADRSPAGNGYYDAFVGGKVDVRAWTLNYPLCSAYGKATFQYKNQVQGCANYTLDLYFHYLNNAYYFHAGKESNCTEVESTCEPNRPPTTALYNLLNSADPSMRLKFFEFAHTEDLGFVDLKINIVAEGSLGFDYDWRFMVAPTRGGVALNGFVQPHALAVLRASVGLWVMPDLLGIEVIAELELINVSLPIIGGINANTLQGCTRISFLTSALGGTLKVRAILVVFDKTFTIYKWKGFGFATNLVDTKCCIECEEACYNAFCNYETGTCECDLWHDGVGCDIDCPPDCSYTDESMSRGIRCELPEFPERGERHRCSCAPGNYGWNCKSECPPTNLQPFGPNEICNGHGTCNEEGLCKCETDYYGADCSITCPFTDETSGERCGSNGRCVYNGEVAKCECFANFVGDKCEATCPVSDDKRKAPCSRRGDCTLIDNKPSCVCHLGFYGDVCENIDTDGSGTAVKFFGNEAALHFDDAIELDAIAFDGTTHMGVWFQIDALPEAVATIVAWKHGRLIVDKNGKVKYCSMRDADCAEAAATFVVGKWYYASAIVRHASPGYEVELRVTLDAALDGRKFETPVTKSDSMPFPLLTSGGVRVGSKFNGKVDLLSIAHKKGGGVALDEFDAVELAKFRDEVVPETQPGLEFYCMFDLKRGAHAYDNIRLLRANMLDAGARFVDSEIALRRAALNSEEFVPFDLPSSTKTRVYPLDFDGKKYESGALAFVYNSDISQSCKISCKINGVEALTGLEPIVGAGIVKYPLNDFALAELVSGDNELQWSAEPSSCKVTISESMVTLAVPAVDAVVDFSGSPYSFVELERDFDFKGSWTVDMWVFRDAVIYTQRGKLLSLIAAEDVGGRQTDKGSIRLYETGSTGRGAFVQYQQDRLQFAQFSTPVGRWFHYTVAVRQSGSQCSMHVLIDGRVTTNPAPSVACGAMAEVAFGRRGQHLLHIGSGFAGKINDLRIRNVAWNDATGVRRDMHRRKTFAEPSLLLAYSFDEALTTNVFDSRPNKGMNKGTIQEGTFRQLIIGIYHKWRNCPGTSYFSPEAVCSTRSIYEHGYCTHERRSADYLCTCNEGFQELDCSGVCPGGAGNICSNHGKCYTFNDTFCVCDEGYVGSACEYECPGWSDPRNIPQRECWGHGDCGLTDDGLEAQCLCDAESQRYGPYCQFSYGEDPVASVNDKCKNCDGEHQVCRDGVCACEEGYYPFFAICKPNAGAMLSPGNLFLFAIVASLLQALI